MKLILLFFFNGIWPNSPIWPTPKKVSIGSETVIISPSFQLTTSNKNSRLERALKRYEELINTSEHVVYVPLFESKWSGRNTLELSKVEVSIKDDELYDFDLETDESYNLSIQCSKSSCDGKINSINVYGAIRGLETLSQLIHFNYEHKARVISTIPVDIEDAPRFPHRGILIDTSRNFIPIKNIQKTIDAMSYNKMNVLHWHLIDSHSFPFESERHPIITKVGTLRPGMTYSKKEVRELVEYGLDRGVRIIPEMEAPAHAYSIGKAIPEIGVCLDDDVWDKTAAEPPSGQLDPSNPKSHQVVHDLIDELSEVFIDKHMHMSGDEFNAQCWSNSPQLSKYVRTKGTTFEHLFSEFALGMHRKAYENKKSIIVWEEALLKSNLTMPKDKAMVQVWLGAEHAVDVVSRGYPLIASSSEYWYLDCGHGQWMGNTPRGKSWCDPFKSWQMIYSYNLIEKMNKEQAKLVKGGEVAIWGEQADHIVLDAYLWPRASAAAEVLWFGNLDDKGKVKGTRDLLPRLNEHRFRMVDRGINAEPLQPLWCVLNPYRCDSSPNLSKDQLPYQLEGNSE